MVIHSVRFAGPRRAGGAGDDAGHVRAGRQQLLAERRLAAARRRGEEDEQGPAVGSRRPDGGLLTFGFWLPAFHSTFCACSRNFSNSAFNVTTSREMTASLALEPMVLTSRFISWARKSRVRPTGSCDFRQSSNCWKWLCNRVSSSEMSERSANRTISFNNRSSSGAGDSSPALLIRSTSC